MVTVPVVNPPLMVTLGVTKLVPLIVTNPLAACVILVIVGKEAVKDTELPESVTVNVELPIKELDVKVSCVALTLVTVPEVKPPVMVTVGVVKFEPLIVTSPLVD